MKYLLLVYGEEPKIQQVDDLHCLAFDQSVRESGHCIASEALQPVATATTVRVRNGKASVNDGPFAETKECLAGFYMIEARDLNEAISIASKHSARADRLDRGAPDPPHPRGAERPPQVGISFSAARR